MAVMFEELDHAKRIELAKIKMEKVLDHFLYLLELHANNALVVYSPILSSQITPSFAANAFNVFQRSMHQFEIVRLCALWDGPDLAKENIPTVIELIDDAIVIDMLAEETRQHWAQVPLHLFNGAEDPELKAAELEAVKRAELEFADEQGSRSKSELQHAIAEARSIFGSTRLASVMNIRDKHLAHALETTRREKRGLVAPMKYGDETALLDQSAPIVERLFCWVNGKSFSIDESRRVDEENAASLWQNCKFENLV
jgi:hypothetical protein